MLCISSRVNAVAHCMLAKHANTFTHVSQSIWETRLWLEKNALSQPFLVYSLTNTYTNTQSPLLISKSYQPLLSWQNPYSHFWDLLIREILFISHLNLVPNANIRSTPFKRLQTKTLIAYSHDATARLFLISLFLVFLLLFAMHDCLFIIMHMLIWI
jgi:hypothetical protein